MNGLDLVLVVAAGLAAWGGWRLGFLRRLSGWIGAAAGLAVGIVLAPRVVERLSLESDLAVFLMGTAVLVVLATLGQGIGAAIGARLRRGVDTPHGRNVDAVGGCALGVVGVVVATWLIVPVMADAAGWPAATARGSTIARFVAEYLPEPPPQIAALEQELAQGGYPQLFTGLRAAPDIGAAPEDSPVSQETLDRAARSAVRLEGPACGRIQSGSGFVVAPGLVATNAHVVAGTEELRLVTADGEQATGRVVAFDPGVDLALVGTELDRPPLELTAPVLGDAGLVLGFPGGGPFAPSPFQAADLIDATGFDIYDRARVDRDLLVLASALEPGDSGSAVLRGDGTVVAIAVAVAPDDSDVAYALDSSELSALLAGGVSGPVPTGACTS